MISLVSNLSTDFVNQSLGSLVANLEQLIYDQNEEAPSLSSYLIEEAKALLLSVHEGDSESVFDFETYLNKLKVFEKKDTYAHTLYDIMSKAKLSGSPTEVLRNIIEQETIRRLQGNVIGYAKNVVLPSAFYADVMGLAEETAVPATHVLGAHEYKNLNRYFQGDVTYASLSSREKQIAESMRYDPVTFTENIPAAEQAMIHELRSQLKTELVNDGVMSLSEMREMEYFELPFSVAMPTYSAEHILAGVVEEDELVGLGIEAQKAELDSTVFNSEKRMRDVLHNNPELSNDELLKKFHDVEEDFVYKPGEKKYFYDIWDEERQVALGDEELSYVLRPPIEGPQLLSESQIQSITQGMEETLTEGEIRSMIAISAEGEIQFEQSGFSHWLNEQKANVSWGPAALYALTLVSEANKDAAKYINIGLSLFTLITTGDVKSILVNLVTLAFDEFGVQSRRAIENQTPDSWKGKRFGYVRRGDKFVPAIISEVELSTGFAQRDRLLKMQFAGEGGELNWVFDGKGSLVPQFSNFLEESFHTNDYEMQDNYSLDYLLNHDVLRDWYFVSPEEQHSLLLETQAGAKWISKPIDLDAIEDPNFKKLENWKRVLDMGSDYEHAPLSKAAGREVIQEYPTTRGLHESYWKEKGHEGGVRAENFGDYFGIGQEVVEKEHQRFLSNHNPENRYLLENIYFNSLRDLIGAQKPAAREQGFDKIAEDYIQSESYPYDETDGLTYWSAQYSGTKTYPPAKTALELQGQFDEIKAENLGKENTDFMSQKVLNRYWMNQILESGGANDLMDFISVAHIDYAAMERPHVKQKEGFVGGRLNLIKNDNAYNILHLLGDYHEDKVLQMPWQFEGESFFPVENMDDLSLTHVHQTYVNNYNSRLPAYEEEWHELTREKVNPEISKNVLIEHRIERGDMDHTDRIQQEVLVDGVWKNAVGFDVNENGDPIVTFSDGTTKNYNGVSMVYVRDLKEYEDGADIREEMIQQLLDDKPDLYHQVNDVQNKIDANEKLTDEDNAILGWLTEYWNGRKGYDHFPHPEEPPPFVQHDEHGEIEAVHFKGEKYTPDEIINAGNMYKDQVEQYFKDEKNVDINFEDISHKEFPDFAFDSEGNIALYGDEKLEKELNLPPNVSAVKDSDGRIHSIWRPDNETPPQPVPDD